MSLDKFRTGDKPSRCLTGEGRREEQGYVPEQLHQRNGLYELPTTAKWKAAR